MRPVLRKPIIAIESPLDYEDLAKAKLQHLDNGISRKIEVPVSTGSSFESVLYTIREFDAAVATLNITSGQDLFNSFRLCLVGNAKDEWDLITKDQERTPEKFKEMLREFKLHFMTDETKANMLEYIESVSKPKDMGVHAFVRRVQLVNRYIDDMPDRHSKLSNMSDTQLKNTVFRAMPPSWQRAFIQSSRKLDDCSLEDIIEYMEQQKSFADSVEDKKKKRKRSYDDANNNNNYHAKKGSRHSHHSTTRSSKHKHYDSHKDHGRYSNDQPCPIHRNGTHNWGMCILNDKGNNYRSADHSARRSDTSSNGNGSGNDSDDTTTRTSNRSHGGPSRNHTKSHNRGGNYRGPTHHAYFSGTDDTESVPSENSSTQSSDDIPSTASSKAGRTQASRSTGRKDGTSRGASLTGYEL